MQWLHGASMPELLTLSRAARLVGVPRGTLQKRIKDGELPTFEGMVKASDLLKVFPKTRLEDNAVLERLAHLRESAYARRIRERILPDPEVLATRVLELGRELSWTRAQFSHYRNILDALEMRFGELERTGGGVQVAAASLKKWLHDQRDAVIAEKEDTERLMAQDSVLRLMAAHVQVLPSNREFFVEGNDTILDAALHAGLSLDYGCSNGNCGLCKARVVSGQVKKVRHHDYTLSEAEKARGYTLLCSNTAVTDLVVEASEAGKPTDIPLQTVSARVQRIDRLSGNAMLRLQLLMPRSNRLRFLAGQSATLEVGGASEELPIASCPCDERHLEFHLRASDATPLTEYAFGQLKTNDLVMVEGPSGDFILREESPRPLVFLAGGTGFAPIKSLVEHAMALEVAETINLYWFASEAGGGHYLRNLCRAWSDALDNFHFTALAADGNYAAALQSIAASHGRLVEFDFYVAGPADFTEASGRFLREHGISPEQLNTQMVA